MTSRPTLSDHDDPAAWAQAVLRRQVERLDELAQLGLELARRAEDAKTFARVAKTVRLTGLLQSKLIKDMDDARRRALVSAPLVEAQARIKEIEQDPAHGHKARVEKIVERQVKALHPNDEEEVERLMLEACERLDDEDIYRDVQTRPVGELVALICRDLGVDPDWPKLAQEAWALEEMASGVEGSPFLAMSDRTRPPPLAGEGDREAVERALCAATPTRAGPW